MIKTRIRNNIQKDLVEKCIKMTGRRIKVSALIWINRIHGIQISVTIIKLKVQVVLVDQLLSGWKIYPPLN